ncbi:MAG: arylsulfatase [Gammaproteobacteria bacterium]|nr:arylsulfatase [Gammaproteobacteria bacterium]
MTVLFKLGYFGAVVLITLIGVCEVAYAAITAKPAIYRPNIVFVLADDLGFSDIAPYGSEVSTPTLSALAERGIRFTNYHTAANCAPARAMLMTGVSSHLAGVPNIPEMLAPQQRVQDNYQGVLGNNVVTIATLLESAGYHTYMAGKWHLGSSPDKLPSRRGFERTVALLDSGADNWEQKPYLPIYETANWYADGQRYQLPEDFYSSEFLVDKTIEFIDSNLQDEQPFFAYIPFQAVHIPVQAPQEFIEPYMGVYDEGWTVLRERRRSRAVALGLIPEDAAMVVMPSTQDWSALDGERQRYEAKRMAVYAGMIEAMDHHIGRLITYLEAEGLLEQTIFIVTSDNGAEASGAEDPSAMLSSRAAASLGYHQDYERLGLKGSFNSISPSFASAAASPLSFYKFYAGEGGLRVPLIISGTAVARPDSITHAFAWATDVAPTILALAGVEAPQGRYAGRPVLPMTGKNLLPLVTGEVQRIYAEEDAVGYELTGHGALFMGDHKIVRNLPPVGDGVWRLYNIASDPGEVIDLREEQPQRFERMRAEYAQFEIDNRVMPLPAGYSQSGQLLSNYLSDSARVGVVVFLLMVLFLLPFAVFYRLRFTQAKRE